MNLSIFIEFYGNSFFPDEATGSVIIPESPSCARLANAGRRVLIRFLRRRHPGSFTSGFVGANAGKCVVKLG
ncbi:MAG: hypothetical protein OXL41_06540 [Nitrospinae bacterium]|nr:hypothetical protein [Nitrospinota bacterium]